jgi:hypothetical protein
VPEPARSWLSFEVGPRAVHDLAEAVAGWLEAPADVRAATRAAIVGVTRERWSWEGVARSVIDVAQGGAAATPIDRIPPP